MPAPASGRPGPAPRGRGGAPTTARQGRNRSVTRVALHRAGRNSFLLIQRRTAMNAEQQSKVGGQPVRMGAPVAAGAHLTVRTGLRVGMNGGHALGPRNL